MFRNTLVIIGAAQFIILFVGLFRAKAFAILLGPGGLGVVSTIDQLVLTLTQFGAFGLPYTALKFMSAEHSISQEAFRRSYSIFLRAIIVLAIVTTILSVIIFSFFPDFIGAEAAKHHKEIQFALLGIAPVMLVMFLSQTFAAAKKPVTAVLFNLVSVGSLACAAILGVMLGGLAGLYIATTATGFVFVVLAIVFLKKKDGLSIYNLGRSNKKESALDTGVFSTAMSVYITLVGYAVCLLLIRVALLSHIGAMATGLLQAALAAALSFGAIITAMTNFSLAPLLNRLAPESDKIRDANDFTGKILLLLLFGGMPIILFPHTILTILYTNEFSTAAAVLVLCVVWQCLHQLMAIYQQLLIGINQVRYMAFSAIVGFVVSGFLVFALVARIGILAGPVALIMGVIVSSILILGRLSLVNKLRLPLRIMLRAFFLFAALYGAYLFLNIGNELSVSGFIARAVYGLIMLGVVWGLLDKSERMTVYASVEVIKNMQQRWRTRLNK